MRNDRETRIVPEAGLEPAPDRLGAVAALLADAACYARNGDGESVKARIAQALLLLGDELTPAAPAPRSARHHSRGAFRGGLSSGQARRLVTYIEANLTRRIRLGDLARLAGVSNGHFCRAFKQTFGMSAHSFLMRRRIEFAQGAMLRTEMPLSEIALTCGLSDQSHFTRAFRRIVGETPHAWRRARRDALDHVQVVRAEAGGSSYRPLMH